MKMLTECDLYLKANTKNFIRNRLNITKNIFKTTRTILFQYVISVFISRNTSTSREQKLIFTPNELLILESQKITNGIG